MITCSPGRRTYSLIAPDSKEYVLSKIPKAGDTQSQSNKKIPIFYYKFTQQHTHLNKQN